MSEPLLRAAQLTKSYPSGPRRLVVLRDLDVAIEAGERVAVIGESGVGKSTLLHLLGGLDRPDAGQVLFRGRDVFSGEPRALAQYRNRHVGFVFQSHHLLPEFTALENVELPFRIGRRSAGSAATARRVLERLGLGDRLHHRPGQLSGGEQQRVAIARAVAGAPDLVLADEPTGNLDPRTGQEVFAALCELQIEREFGLVVVTHSERLARGADRVLRLGATGLRALGADETRAYFDALGAEACRDPML
jgi:lipoprotein-releasing system ATP-binding protein